MPTPKPAPRLIAHMTYHGTRWTVSESWRHAGGDDAEPVRSLEFQRHGDRFPHTAESFREETRRDIPDRVRAWALGLGVPASGIPAPTAPAEVA